MTLVVDASVAVAAVLDSGTGGQWARQMLASDELVAPHFMPVEAASVLRSLTLSGTQPEQVTAVAYAKLFDLPIDLFPFRPLAERVWALKANVSAYDAWYVALAESLNASLITLDVRLSRAPGPVCGFVVPPQ